MPKPTSGSTARGAIPGNCRTFDPRVAKNEISLEEVVMPADHPSRRSFLREAIGTVGLLPSAAVALGEFSRVLAAAAEKGEDYWALVRQQFSFPERKIPMNAANLCPSPAVVAERVTELTRDIDNDCSFQNRGKFEGLLEASRQKVAQQLGVTADEIALVRNTSEANN